MSTIDPLAIPDLLPAAKPAGRLALLADRTGATASLLCAVHCMLLPFVLAALPLIGLGFLAGHAFERGFVLFAAVLASASLLTSYRRHRRPQALYLMVPAIALLVFGISLDIDAHLAVHTAAVVAGGLLLSAAHVTNLWLGRRCRARTCAHAPA